MTYSLVGKRCRCGELDLFFVAGRVGVDLFFGGCRNSRAVFANVLF